MIYVAAYEKVEAASAEPVPGMVVGLGTTANFAARALARRYAQGARFGAMPPPELTDQLSIVPGLLPK
jgi:hypothetical protein